MGTYEAGLVRIPPEQARKLRLWRTARLDYRGSMTDLHPHIRAKIKEERNRPA
jgi:hypothetical protein